MFAYNVPSFYNLNVDMIFFFCFLFLSSLSSLLCTLRSLMNSKALFQRVMEYMHRSNRTWTRSETLCVFIRLFKGIAPLSLVKKHNLSKCHGHGINHSCYIIFSTHKDDKCSLPTTGMTQHIFNHKFSHVTSLLCYIPFTGFQFLSAPVTKHW